MAPTESCPKSLGMCLILEYQSSWWNFVCGFTSWWVPDTTVSKTIGPGFKGFYTNHSLRATAITRLQGCMPRRQWTAYHRENCVREYKHINDEQLQTVIASQGKKAAQWISWHTVIALSRPLLDPLDYVRWISTRLFKIQFYNIDYMMSTYLY
jgi:hypothetical protein